jgi:hypothetical protein
MFDLCYLYGFMHTVVLHYSRAVKGFWRLRVRAGCLEGEPPPPFRSWKQHFQRTRNDLFQAKSTWIHASKPVNYIVSQNIQNSFNSFLCFVPLSNQ